MVSGEEGTKTNRMHQAGPVADMKAQKTPTLGRKTQPANVRLPLKTTKKHLELSINENMEVNLTWPRRISLTC